jgi:hypothetical protein
VWRNPGASHAPAIGPSCKCGSLFLARRITLGGMTHGHSAAQSSVEKLENDLLNAREAVLDLLPHELREAVESYHRCETRDDERRWREQVIEHVRGMARVLARNEVWTVGGACLLPVVPLRQLIAVRQGFAFLRAARLSSRET